MLNFFILEGQRDEFVEFFSDPLKHKEILGLLLLICWLNCKRSNLHETTKSMVS